MIRRLLVAGPVTLAACSGRTPAETPAIPSTILLPAATSPGPAVMVLGELSGVASNPGNTRVAVARVTMLDGGRQPVAGALVSGEWNEGDTDRIACMTDGTGTCELESGSIRKRVSKTTMEIIDVTHESLSFDDPDDHGRELIIHKP